MAGPVEQGHEPRSCHAAPAARSGLVAVAAETESDGAAESVALPLTLAVMLTCLAQGMPGVRCGPARLPGALQPGALQHGSCVPSALPDFSFTPKGRASLPASHRHGPRPTGARPSAGPVTAGRPQESAAGTVP